MGKNLLTKYIEESFSTAVIPAYKDDLIHLYPPISPPKRALLIRDCAFRFDWETWADIFYYIINNTKFVKNSKREYSNLYGKKAELSFSFALCPETSVYLSLRNFYEDFLKYNYDKDDEEDDYDILLRKDILNYGDEDDENEDDENEVKADLYRIDLGLKDIANFNYLQISVHSKYFSEPLSLTQSPDIREYYDPFFATGYTIERFEEFIDRIEKCAANISNAFDEFAQTHRTTKKRRHQD